MTNSPGSHVWQGTDAYEAYMGRWSRQLAPAFLAWLAAPAGGRWLDVGCGTGALTEEVLESADPAAVVGIDPSPEFIATAAGRQRDPRVRFEVGDAGALPIDDGSVDVVVAGLVLNHVPDPELAVAEMVRAARAGGTVAAYVWDYRGEMQLIRVFWEAAVAADANAGTRDPRAGASYRISEPEPLADLFREARMVDVRVEAIDLPMRFPSFDDYWEPHIMPGSSSNAQRYVGSLDDEQRRALREQLRSRLPVAADGTIELIGRAWAVRGTTPHLG